MYFEIITEEGFTYAEYTASINPATKKKFQKG